MPKRDVYYSKAWQGIRKAVWLKQKCLCAMCGRPVYVSGISDFIPKEKRLIGVVHHKQFLTEDNYYDMEIAFSEDNLIGICQDCHNDIHKPSSCIKNEYEFDELGNLIRSKKDGKKY